ncbi:MULTISPECIES: glycosyltransferase [Pseudonocardia]|uniref:glycosyltransferase n=1 Tax=Pseudonocardia TaxID=1847 RepID=UPI0018D4EF97|nr:MULTISPECIES: glycosyltransferase [Pseudonocardia]
MRVLVLAPGSTGDVAPYTGLGRRLTADGHHVAVAANERFRAMVTDAGLEFRLLRGDPEAGNTTADGRRRHVPPGLDRCLPRRGPAPPPHRRPAHRCARRRDPRGALPASRRGAAAHRGGGGRRRARVGGAAVTRRPDAELTQPGRAEPGPACAGQR